MQEKQLDGDFEYFIEELHRTNVTTEASEALIEKYRGKVADALLEYWEIEGFRAYGDGIIWLTNPDAYQEALDIYLKDTPFEQIDNFYVFSRTAFGKLYAVGKITGQTITINIAANTIVAVENELKKIAKNRDEIIQSHFMMGDKEEYNYLDMFDKAYQKFGMLKSGEVYAFSPHLTLGGELELDRVVIKNIFDYIKETRALAKPSVPFAGITVNYDTMEVTR